MKKQKSINHKLALDPAWKMIINIISTSVIWIHTCVKKRPFFLLDKGWIVA